MAGAAVEATDDGLSFGKENALLGNAALREKALPVMR
jgi:hypothetical protein